MAKGLNFNGVYVFQQVTLNTVWPSKYTLKAITRNNLRQLL